MHTWLAAAFSVAALSAASRSGAVHTPAAFSSRVAAISMRTSSDTTVGISRACKRERASVTQGTGVLSAEQARAPPLDQLRQASKDSNQGTSSPTLGGSRTRPPSACQACPPLCPVRASLFRGVKRPDRSRDSAARGERPHDHLGFEVEGRDTDTVPVRLSRAIGAISDPINPDGVRIRSTPTEFGRDSGQDRVRMTPVTSGLRRAFRPS